MWPGSLTVGMFDRHQVSISQCLFIQCLSRSDYNREGLSQDVTVLRSHDIKYSRRAIEQTEKGD
jgi:hypothetical protein